MAAAKRFPEPVQLGVHDLPRLFNPDAAEGVEANYQLQVRGAGGAESAVWTLSVYHGKCGLLPGDDLEADVTLVFDLPVLEELIAGLNDVATLYTQRRLSLRGNVNLALRFPRLFHLP